MAVTFVNIGAGGVGNETFENVVVNDSLTVNGPFTSPGIDDNATSTAVTIDSSGSLLVGTAVSGTSHKIFRDVSEGGITLLVSGAPTAGEGTTFQAAGAGGYNAANAAQKVGRNTVTSRSINAGGTVNASGADYAEYELKADGCGEFTKGDIVGFDANGKLTDVFANAVSFAIKSTNPSYVGGDTWHDGLERPEQPAQAEDETDDDFAGRVTQWEADLATFEAALEEKRQRVDRIAYAGKVPVNGIDGATPGHKVIAVDDGNGGITCVTKASPTFEEYMNKCVGTVRNNGTDGRAIVEVKMG